jgi:hypothetical protein
LATVEPPCVDSARGSTLGVDHVRVHDDQGFHNP